MEIKVHVENTIRTVCGLDQDTTVQDIIIALAFSLRQTGRFYLIENHQSTKFSCQRLPRIMAPREKPFEILNKYLSFLDEDRNTEFHLVKSNEEVYDASISSASNTSMSNDSFNLNKLLNNISLQQNLLEEQSNRLSNLLKEIENHEIFNMNLNKKSTFSSNEMLKRKLLILDLKNQLNEKKINKLENTEENTESALRKEIELSQFLNAQRAFFKRKIDLADYKLECLENEYDKLKVEYNFLIDSLPQKDQIHEPFYNDNLIEGILNNYEESLKQFDINKAKINYLELGTLELDKNLNSNINLAKSLENEYNNLVNCEININNIRDENKRDTESDWSSSSSSECLSNHLGDFVPNKETVSNSLKLPSREFSNQRYSKIRKLNSVNKANNNLYQTKRSLFGFDDVHYF